MARASCSTWLQAALATGLSACLVPAHEASGLASSPVDPAVSGAVSADPGSRYADPIWPPFGGDRSRAARSTLVGPQSAEAAQLFALGDGFVIAQVVGGDGTVYALSFEGTISAVDGRTGEVDWTFQGLDIFSPALGPDGTLYVGIAARRGLRAGAGARRGRDLYVGTQGGLMAIAP